MIKLENTSTAAIYLPLIQAPGPGDSGKEIAPFDNDTVIVPRARKVEETDPRTGDRRSTTINGTAEIADDVWERLQKKKVVAAYLSSGRLRVAGSAGPPPASATPAGGKGVR